MLSRQEDVRAAYADLRLSASRGDQLFRGMPPELRQRLEWVGKFGRLNVNRLDGPDHTPIRVLPLKALGGPTLPKVGGLCGQGAQRPAAPSGVRRGVCF